MNIYDLKKLPLSELKNKLEELKGQLLVMKFQIASGKFNKYADVKKTKIQIAQIFTLIRERKTAQKK